MRHSGICILLLLVVVALLSIIPMSSGGCGSSANITKTTKTAISTIPTSTTGGGGQTPTATSTAPRPGGMPDIADMKSLPSYRLSIMNKGVQGIATGTVTTLKYEWVRDTKAEHVWMEDANGKITEVYIRIGDKYWMWMGIGDIGWVEQQPQATSSISSDLSAQLKQVMQDVANSKAHFDKKGTETVNNVKCIHYEFEYNLTTELPNFSGEK
jgi:hypothetical protein